MPIRDSMRRAFTDENVGKSPDSPGVYALYDGDELIYIGMSEESIRSRLQDHKSGAEGQDTADATAYQRETCADPAAREQELLREFKRTHGRLPRCNEVTP